MGVLNSMVPYILHEGTDSLTSWLKGSLNKTCEFNMPRELLVLVLEDIMFANKCMRLKKSLPFSQLKKKKILKQDKVSSFS